ncbi:MAG: hypothetical protein FK733_09180 [Asgard group archaeon]|nr:hypothetical protein [Asgard group archaeon]
MGTDGLVKKIDLVVMTGTVPFITAGIFQEDTTDATLISGALTGMSNMFQELLKQGELRHSELHNAHVYIRHLSQMNDTQGLISPEIKHNAQMRVAFIVREGELPREQELALSELCYSIMVKICEKPKFSKKLIKGNAEGYIPTYHETLDILAEAIKDYRKRARKSTFYEKPNFLQEKEKFSTLSVNDSILESQIRDFTKWLKEDYYPDFFPKLPFEHFFGKEEYWKNINELKITFNENLQKKSFKDRVSAALIQYILQGGLLPLALYSGNIQKRLNLFCAKELPQVFEDFIDNLLPIRGPFGICLRAIDKAQLGLSLDDCNKIGWQFLHNFIKEIGNRPFEQTYLKQFCKLLEQFDLKSDFLRTVINSHNEIVPQTYLTSFAKIINSQFSKSVDLSELIDKEKPTPQKPLKRPAPSIPDSVKTTKTKKKKTKESQKVEEQSIKLPKATPESTLIKNQALLQATSRTFNWAHRFLFGEFSLSKKNLPQLSNDGLLFYNLSESLTVELGLILDLMQAFSGPRSWLIGQLERIVDNVESKLRDFSSGKSEKYDVEKKMTIDVKYVDNDSRKIAERIFAIASQIESDAKKNRISKDNIKSYLESGFLGRSQENSIPNTRKLLVELKSLNKNQSIKELSLISKAMGVNIKEITSNITSLQLLAIPLPEKDSDYPKIIREIITRFKKWNIKIENSISTIFRVSYEIDDPKSPLIHDSMIPQYLRNSISNSNNEKLSQSSNSDFERLQLVESSFTFKKQIFKLIGDRLLFNKPLEVFTSILLTKNEEEKHYLFDFAAIKPPTITDEINKFFLISYDNEQPSIIGRLYTYIPFDNEQINNLTELLISDAYRRALECIQPGLNIITKIIKKYHSGISNLHNQLTETYELICNQLSISKTTN